MMWIAGITVFLHNFLGQLLLLLADFSREMLWAWFFILLLKRTNRSGENLPETEAALKSCSLDARQLHAASYTVINDQYCGSILRQQTYPMTISHKWQENLIQKKSTQLLIPRSHHYIMCNRPDIILAIITTQFDLRWTESPLRLKCL